MQNLIYNGYWYSKERFKLQKIIDLKKNKVNGSIKLKLYKGNVYNPFKNYQQ